MLRSNAMELLNELTTTSDILYSSTQISLHLNENNQTTLLIRTALDDYQKELLAFIVNKRELKLVECPHNVWMIY